MRPLPITIAGLTEEEIQQSRKQFGTNQLSSRERSGWVTALINTFKEPMFIFLLAASVIYFITGKTGDGLFMVSAIVLVSLISLYQDSRSRNALAALKEIAQPLTTVVRDGTVITVKTKDIVVGDIIMIEEGSILTADATIIYSNDFSVNESVLTGESLSVIKNKEEGNNTLFTGSLVVSGMAIARVSSVGNQTQLGKIGKSLEEIKEEKTPLQKQIELFVRNMALIGVIVFAIVWAVNYYHSNSWLDSLLKALTLAMSILPEEIPVAFTTFMALGAWRLMKMGIIVKQTKTVETLGSASVICTDKTGTITENIMQLAEVYVYDGDLKIEKIQEDELCHELIETAMFASEPMPFDPMEKVLHEAYTQITKEDKRKEYQMVHEYPLAGNPPMMTHLFENAGGEILVAAKGAPEKILSCCNLTNNKAQNILSLVNTLGAKGYRVLAVCKAELHNKDYPKDQENFAFRFIGLVSFYDPPKKGIDKVFEKFYRAGIAVKIITGDNKATTKTIASLVNFNGADKAIDGEDLMKLTNEELSTEVMNTNIFTRMYPNAKLAIINALKKNNLVVAMTGDGVNDGPALKAAHIGIAMGKKGTEMAKEASSLILSDDDLGKMVDAIAMGRRIYSNLKKAIQYIISIHIPIIITVTAPLLLGWIYPNIFSPVHVIFLELIMGPTCSIVYENEPLEANSMDQPPRAISKTFLSWKELSVSVWQGLIISLGVLTIYQFAIHTGYNEDQTRTAVFVTLISANIFLTLVNRSFYYSILQTLKYNNWMLRGMLLFVILIVILLVTIPSLTQFFSFQKLSWQYYIASIIMGFISVAWFEVYKIVKRSKKALKK